MGRGLGTLDERVVTSIGMASLGVRVTGMADERATRCGAPQAETNRNAK
jgi:hypothetical protein